jgi:glutamine synthetase
VSLLHVGGDGRWKTLDFVPRSRAHFEDILEGGERADGSSLFAGSGIPAGASDILLRPRIGSAFLHPFSGSPALVVLAGHARRDGRPLPESPDTIVRRAAARLARETGVLLEAHGEVEFYLGKRCGENDMPGGRDAGYHASAPDVFGEDLRREALVALAGMGVPVKYAHSEVGSIEAPEADGIAWEQHEIELALAPLPDAAEHVALTRWVLAGLAHRRNLRVSFDPILRRGHPGSGLHVHFSPVAGGEPRGGFLPDGRLHDEARWLIGGLVRTGAALMAFGNRVEGSFIRLAQAREAPNSITWGACDRSALIRLPVVARTESGRAVGPPTVEFRLPDGSAHAHLLLAGAAQAMTRGRATRDLDALLESTAGGAAGASAGTPPGARAAAPVRARDGGGSGTGLRVPKDPREVADALERDRAVFEEGEVIPGGLIDRRLEELRA